jgi:putative flippase GtrA
MLTRTGLIVRYLAFAIISMLANFAAQQASLIAYDGAQGLHLSILIGTGVGFVLKYGLDRRFIFFDTVGDAPRETVKILLYGATGVFTTLVFWGFELGAWRLFGTSSAKFAGGALGLAIGYVMKYGLDRRFVFPSRVTP